MNHVAVPRPQNCAVSAFASTTSSTGTISISRCASARPEHELDDWPTSLCRHNLIRLDGACSPKTAFADVACPDGFFGVPAPGDLLCGGAGAAVRQHGGASARDRSAISVS